MSDKPREFWIRLLKNRGNTWFCSTKPYREGYDAIHVREVTEPDPVADEEAAERWVFEQSPINRGQEFSSIEMELAFLAGLKRGRGE